MKCKVGLLIGLFALGVLVAIVFSPPRDVVVVVEYVYFTDVADVNSVVEPNEFGPGDPRELVGMPVP